MKKETVYICETCKNMNQLFKISETMKCNAFWVTSGEIPTLCKYYKPDKKKLYDLPPTRPKTVNVKMSEEQAKELKFT